ncbi:MAG TPA: Do family serine endopeptidase [Stellaceae bacterium]|nr:Do family serine endopeptidase [Stellaceae bacterium]
MHINAGPRRAALNAWATAEGIWAAMSINPSSSAQASWARRRIAAITLVLGLGVAPIACAQHNVAADPPAVTPQQQTSPASLPSFADTVRNVLPAVVKIMAVRTSRALGDEEEQDEGMPDSGQGVPPPLEEFLKRFFGLPNEPDVPTRLTVLGAGFIIDSAGYVVTDTHVIADARQVTVILQDDRRYPAKIVGQDEVSDLALLKIDAGSPVPSVAWGDSDAARVGDWILAVGNPFGLGSTVSAGIISARGRDIHAGPYDDFLQIDAPLNRGNSGGPTFNLAGQVIGINTAIYTPSGGSVGIGFAIPSNLAKPVIDQLRAHGRVSRGWLGVQLQDVTVDLAKSFRLPRAEGAVVVDVTPDGPADQAGIRQGDVILAFNGRAIAKPRDLSMSVAQAPIGKTAAITAWRGGRSLMLAPVIAEKPQATPAPRPATPEQPNVAASLGLRLAPLTAKLRRELRLPATATGVVVMEMSRDSPLAASGLERGDVIEEINHRAVTTPQAAAAPLKEALAAKGQSVLMLINRQGSKRYIVFSPGTGGELE